MPPRPSSRRSRSAGRRGIRGISPRDLIVGGLVAAVAIAMAVQAARYSAARSREDTWPSFALSMAPNLPPALVAQAEQILAANAQTADSAQLARAGELGKQAIRASALSAPALRIVGLTEKGNVGKAEALLKAAHDVSRRDVGSQLVLIEMAVAANDIGTALKHYDETLRISPSLGPVLYPVMLTAATDPQVRQSLNRLIASDPAWLPRLAQWVVENPDNLRNYASLLPAVPLTSKAFSADMMSPLIDGLAKQGALGSAYMAYNLFRKSTMGAQAKNPTPPFDWAVTSSYDFGADPVGDKPNSFSVFARTEGSHDVLERLVRLPAGQHWFSFRLSDFQGSNGRLAVRIGCAGGKGAGDLAVVAIAPRPGLVSIPFTVAPADCPFQWVRLSATAKGESLDAQLDDLKIGK